MIDVLIIGYGSIGRKHAKLLSKNKKVNDIYVVTSQKISNYITINLNDLKDIDPKLIIISNITSLHIKTIKFIEKIYKNKRVLVEKPIFAKMDRFKPRNNNYYVGYNLRLHPVIRKIKAIIKNKIIWHVDIKLESYLPDWRKNIIYSKSNSSNKSMGGGVLLDLSHELDYLNLLFGKINPLYCYNGKKSDLDIDSDDLLIMSGHFGNSKKRTSLSLMINSFSKNNSREIRIAGKDISIVGDIRNNVIKYTFKDKYKIIKFKKNSLEDTYSEQHNLIINGVTKELCSFSDAIDTLSLITKLRKINNYV